MTGKYRVSATRKEEISLGYTLLNLTTLKVVWAADIKYFACPGLNTSTANLLYLLSFHTLENEPSTFVCNKSDG